MQIGEGVTVMASFGKPYRIKPLSFTWSGRTIDVKEVTYAWNTKEGQKELHHFSITELKAVDSLNDKFGDFTVTWASYMKTMEPQSVISPAWRPSGVRNLNIKK